MVSICLEYVEERAEKVYIYCSYEEGILSSDFFYYIEGELKQNHKLNEGSKYNYDVSSERQEAVLDILLENLEEMISLCKESDKEMPNEIKDYNSEVARAISKNICEILDFM